MNEYSQALHYIMLDTKATLNYGKQLATIKKLVDKSEPLEPMIVSWKDEEIYACRVCGVEINLTHNYCENCGQRIG